MKLPHPTDGNVLFEQQGVEVRETARFRWLQDHGAIQSVMDRSQPSRLVLTTHQAMLAAWPVPSSVSHVLNLGSGLGSFERLAEAHCPDVNWTAIESSELIVELARNYFSWPANYQIETLSAHRFIENCRQVFDVIFVDLFTDQRTAACLYDEEFFSRLSKRLRDDGAIAFNTIPNDQADMLAMLLPLRRHFRTVWLAETINHSNVILIASNTEQPKQLDADDRVKSLCSQFDISSDMIVQKFILLPDAN